MVSSLYIALLALLYLALCVHVIRGRWRFKLPLGDGGEDSMKQRIAAQRNFAEYTPLFLVMLCVAEVNGLSASAIHAAGAAFLWGRMFHAYSLTAAEHYVNGQLSTYPRYRTVGMVLTFASLAFLAFALLAQYAKAYL